MNNHIEITIALCIVLTLLNTPSINWCQKISKNDLVWNINLDSSFFRITFIDNTMNQPSTNITLRIIRLDIWNGKTSRIISTEKGEINLTAIEDGKNNDSDVKMNTTDKEPLVKIGFRENWVVSTTIYGEKQFKTN